MSLCGITSRETSMTRYKPAAYRGKKKTREDVVARRLARKPITFSFTENGTDPGNRGEVCQHASWRRAVVEEHCCSTGEGGETDACDD
jgi:hypothetical protein